MMSSDERGAEEKRSGQRRSVNISSMQGECLESKSTLITPAAGLDIVSGSSTNECVEPNGVALKIERWVGETDGLIPYWGVLRPETVRHLSKIGFSDLTAVLGTLAFGHDVNRGDHDDAVGLSGLFETLSGCEYMTG